MHFTYKRVTTDEELYQILAIQARNSKAHLSISEIHQEGFITVVHDFDLLKKMNDCCAHIIAKRQSLVVGYALAMSPKFKDEIAVLKSMFDVADELLQEKKFLAMGQICIDKHYRKRGVFRNLYEYYKSQLKDDYDCLITEVATSNLRSLNAHKSIGFETIKTYQADSISWELIKWDWR